MEAGRPSVGIDGYNIAMPNGTGIATYARTLAATLRDAGHRVEGVFGIDVGDDPALRETLFFERLARPGRLPFSARYWPLPPARAAEVPMAGRVEAGAFADRLPTFDRVVSAPHLFPHAVRYFRRTGRFARLRVERPPAIMHWTYPVPIRLEGARNVYTLHDLVPLRLPHTTLDAKRHFDALVRGCGRVGDMLCTVSEASRRDIVDLLGVDPSRVVNCYQASPLPPGLIDRPREEDEAAIRHVLGLEPRGYFLYLGAIEPKKNVGRLIEAHLSTGLATPLVLAGGRAWASEGELALLGGDVETPHGASVARRVIRLDHLPRALLLQLIRSAKAVVFPSIYEGFGLPVLEAMQLGTPVLTSTAGSLPEVAGEAALLVDPYDVRAIADGLRALDRDEGLRGRLAAAGPAQAARFSQARFAERLQAMYDRIASAPVSR